MPKTVITVDDSMSIRETVKMTLQSAGYQVLTAEDGTRGLSVCLAQKADLVITDLKALSNAKVDLADLDGITYEPDPYTAARGCDAIAIMTEWKLYTELDYKRIYDSMAKPAFIFDGRNILNHRLLHDIGFNVYPIGKPPLVHF